MDDSFDTHLQRKFSNWLPTIINGISSERNIMNEVSVSVACGELKIICLYIKQLIYFGWMKYMYYRNAQLEEIYPRVQNDIKPNTLQ